MRKQRKTKVGGLLKIKGRSVEESDQEEVGRQGRGNAGKLYWRDYIVTLHACTNM